MSIQGRSVTRCEKVNCAPGEPSSSLTKTVMCPLKLSKVYRLDLAEMVKAGRERSRSLINTGTIVTMGLPVRSVLLLAAWMVLFPIFIFQKN